MKCPPFFLAGLALGLVSQFTFARDFASVRLIPHELTWRDMGEGVQYAPITGNERTDGVYVYRVTFPKGHKNVPHFHSDERVITIVQGSLYVGYGTVFDETKMKKLSPGSVFTEPKDQPHYVWAKDETVVMQVTGNGPSRRSLVEQVAQVVEAIE